MSGNFGMMPTTDQPSFSAINGDLNPKRWPGELPTAMSTASNFQFFESPLGSRVRLIAGKAKSLREDPSSPEAHNLLDGIAQVRHDFPQRPDSPLNEWLNQLQREVEEKL